MADEMEASLKPVVDQKSLKWIFVGGKGGVGKTTTSCSLAVQMAKARKSVLLISTDPAHNLSDAFGQKFGKDAKKVEGVEGLAAMEIDPNGSINDLISAGGDDAQEAMQGLGGVGNMFQDMAFSIPGVDEAMSFAEVLKQVKGMEYEVIIFDTAPTGHTLRFLQFPTTLEKALEKLSALSQQFGGMINNLVSARGGLPNGQSFDDVLKKMEDLRNTIGDVNKQFKNPDLTTFIPVLIPEFLSLYETERMIQELGSYEIDTHAMVVNQLLFPKKDNPCEQCNARRKMQRKYLEQIDELYGDDFNVVKMPLLVDEVRGVESITKFSEMLVEPFEAPHVWCPQPSCCSRRWPPHVSGDNNQTFAYADALIGSTLMPIFQTLSLVDYTVRDQYLVNSTLLQRSAHMQVWAYGMSSRTASLGVIVATAGVLVVLAQFVLALLDRRRSKSLADFLVAALAHTSHDHLFEHPESKTHTARVRFKLLDEHHHPER